MFLVRKLSVFHKILPTLILAGTLAAPATNVDVGLVKARNNQDLKSLDEIISRYKQAAAADQKSADSQYRLALAYSYAAEVALELRDKKRSEGYAETGIDPARGA